MNDLTQPGQKYIRKTIQRGIKAVMNPHISQWYPNNERMLRNPHTPHPLFTDTMIAGTFSTHRNNNAQVYGPSFGWTRFPPTKLKSDTYETLPLIFKSDGVPPEMDNSKDQLSSDFCKKLHEDNFHQKTIKP